MELVKIIRIVNVIPFLSLSYFMYFYITGFERRFYVSYGNKLNPNIPPMILNFCLKYLFVICVLIELILESDIFVYLSVCMKNFE